MTEFYSLVSVVSTRICKLQNQEERKKGYKLQESDLF